MTRRRTRLLVGLAILALGIVVAAAALPESTPRPGRATFEKVKVGMNRAEVEATVGGPPGLYEDGGYIGRRGEEMLGCDTWVTDDGELLVQFSADGTASGVHIWDTILLRPRTFFTSLRARLGF